ncbi:hypothetical protein BH20ACI4_BH20ACI4_16220 [soil metagenome]
MQKSFLNVRKINFLFLAAFSIFLLQACVPKENTNTANTTNSSINSTQNTNSSNDENASTDVEPYGQDENLSEQQVEQGRLDQDWKKFVQLDASTEKNNTPNKEKWSDVTAENINNQKQYLPLSGNVAGASVFRVQILLDRTNFSPGIVDAKWGKNTEKAVYWLQKKEGLPANGQVDQKTFQRLIELAGNPEKLVVERKLSEKDVAGEFKKLPGDIYEKAKMDCMCYESLEEKLSEMFHTSPALLKQLNPNVTLNDLKAGDSIFVPNLQTPMVLDKDSKAEKSDASNGENTKKDVARIVVSDGGHFVHGLDSAGQIVVHYPSTLGSEYNPSPSGEYKINSVTKNPWWHYQPKLLNEGSGPNARIPPGPNNAVGLVWMDLSKPHYGIHGTSAPETIGYATSHGCIRLTNWDALDLGGRIEKGVPVEFRDTVNRSDDSQGNSNKKTG